MSVRSAIALLFVPVLAASIALGKEKKKVVLPDYVLRARTVMVVISPGSEVPLAGPGENREARDAVEQAISKWGRFQFALDPQTADLVISVRRGRTVNPVITGGPTADRPVILQNPGDGQVRVGGEQGRRPGVSNPGIDTNPSPRAGTEVGPADDLMEVYRGGIQDPLDSPPAWQYSAHNALQAPTVPAVGQFRKAIEQAEKQQKSKP